MNFVKYEGFVGIVCDEFFEEMRRADFEQASIQGEPMAVFGHIRHPTGEIVKIVWMRRQSKGFMDDICEISTLVHEKIVGHLRVAVLFDIKVAGSDFFNIRPVPLKSDQFFCVIVMDFLQLSFEGGGKISVVDRGVIGRQG